MPLKKWQEIRPEGLTSYKEFYRGAQISSGVSSRQPEDKEVLLCRVCAHFTNSFLLEDYMWWVSVGKKHCGWCAAICGEKYEWRAPNRLLVVQTNMYSASQERCSKRMRYRKVCVKTRSMRSTCWPTCRKMQIAQSRVVLQACEKEAGR